MLFGKPRTYVLDFETLADQRVGRFLSLGLVSGTLLVPEPPTPRTAAETTDHRSHRAWEAIDELRRIKDLTVKLDRKLCDRDALFAALRRSKATLLTLNPELKSAAGGLPVIVLSEIHALFKPQFLPGAELRVKVTKKGKEKDEGIGYLDGGIKVVVENAAGVVGSDIEVVVQGTLETDVGRVVFAKPKFVEVK